MNCETLSNNQYILYLNHLHRPIELKTEYPFNLNFDLLFLFTIIFPIMKRLNVILIR